MSAVQPLVLADSQTTDQTFGVVMPQDSLKPATWVDRSVEPKAMFKKITLAVREQPEGNTKVEGRILLPQTDGITGEVTNCFFKLEFSLPPSSTLLARQDCLAFARELMIDTVITNAVEQLSAPY